LGYFCAYAPLEVLHAAGFSPLRLLQSSGPVPLANAHLPAFCCALARATTERMLSDELAFLQGVLFVHTCDTMQCLADVWRMANPQLRVHTFSPPTVLDHAESQPYCVAELRRLARTLESEHGLAITYEALRHSIRLYNEQRHLVGELDQRPSRLSDWDRWALTLAGMWMPVEEHIALLRALLDEAADASAEAGDGPAVYLVGAVLDDPAIVELIAELGGRVAGDDLCTGSRSYDTLVDEDMEPYAALTQRMLRRVPCPTKHSQQDERRSSLIAALQVSGAQGVIFVVPKFCEPHAFDYVPLSQAVAELGLGQLLIETDVTVPREALRTRLQAFLEMLQEKAEEPGASPTVAAPQAARTP
jgi:benzoyl-CoA reductase/2-hydroxyglutaryl-CoA dehydratase subunit BcrC/BadD/HgdB